MKEEKSEFTREVRIVDELPRREELISESVTETDEGHEITTNVFQDRVEVIKRTSDGGLEVEILVTDGPER
ncbi:hypothetical protein ACFQH6_18035 [Halobacteriaceae archaeon GCM10025711]